MLEKGKLSAFQMSMVMYPTVLGTGFLALPTITAQYAENDLWMTGFLPALTGLMTIYITTWLHKLYPKQTVIQYSEQIAGKIPGKIIGALFFLYFLQAAGPVSRQFAAFISANFLLETPTEVIVSSIILLCAFAVRGGAEVIARSAVIFTPIFILPLFLLFFLIPDLDFGNIFPILSRGIVPVLKGSIAPQAWTTNLFFMSFFLPLLTDPEKGRKWAFFSLTAIIFSMIYINLITLFLLGPNTGNKIYPVLAVLRYISIADFFTNLEAVLLATWVLGNFIQIVVFYYSAVLSFGQLLKLSDYRPVVFPMGVLIVVSALWDKPNFSKLAEFLRTTVPFFVPTFMMVIPLFLLLMALIRKKAAGGERAR